MPDLEMAAPRVLFVSCMTPSAHRSASMAQMAALLDQYADHFAWFALRKPKEPNPFPVPLDFAEPLARPARIPRRLNQILNLGPWAAHMGRLAADFGRQHHADVVLTDMAFEAVVAGRVAAQKLGLPLLTMVQDPPVNRLRTKGYPVWFLWWYERQFAKTMRASRRCAVVSDYMGEAYRQRYGVETATLYLGVDPSSCLEPRPFSPHQPVITIGSVGSILSASNWDLLIQTVRLLNRAEGKDRYRILHIGTLPAGIQAAPEAEVTGWISDPAEMQRHLARLHLGFLNYPFDPEFAETGRTSFPTKIHSYIQAQVPMIALGTADSTVIRFVQDYHCGAVCASPDAEKMAECIREFSLSQPRWEDALVNLARLKQVFSRENFYEAFQNFVNLPDRAKLP